MKGSNCFYEIERAEREAGILRVRLCGEMDHHNASALRVELDKLISEERPKKVIMDMSGIGLMDSSGLGFVMGRFSLTQKLGGEFILENPGERIMKIFELAGLSRIIRIEAENKEDER